MYPVNTPSLPAGSEPLPRELTIRELASRLVRRKWSILITLCIFLSAGVGLSLVTEPAYRSEMLLTIQGAQLTPNLAASDPLDAVSLPFSNVDYVTQIQLLQSYDVVLPAFQQANVTLPPPGSTIPGPTVDAKAIPLSNSVIVSVTAQDPGKSQEIALAIPQAFNRYMQDQRDRQVSGLVTSLRTKLDDAKKTVDADIKSVAEFRRTHNLSASEADQSDALNRVSRALDAKLTADASLESAHQRYNDLLRSQREITKNVGSRTQAGNFNEIASLEAALTQMLGDKEQLRITYRDDAPQVREMDAKIRLQRQLIADSKKRTNTLVDTRNSEVLDIDARVRQAKSDYEAAQASARMFSAGYESAQQHQKGLTELAPQLAELTTKLNLDQADLETLQRRLTEIQARTSSVKEPATILQAPSIPVKVRPSWTVNLAVSLALGIIFSLGIVAFREQVDDRVTSAGKAYELTGLAPLGYLPRIRSAAGLALTSLPGALQNRYRMLRYSILFARRPEEPRAILVVRSGRRQDRTSTAQNLALSMAADGLKVILVDADALNPTLSMAYGSGKDRGLFDVLEGTSTLDEVLKSTSVEGLSVLPLGTPTKNSADHFASTKMASLVESLKAAGDFVVIETSPALSSVDASVLGAQTDAVVLLSELGVTRTQDLRRSVSLLLSAGCSIAGIAYVNTTGEEDSTVDVNL